MQAMSAMRAATAEYSQIAECFQWAVLAVANVGFLRFLPAGAARGILRIGLEVAVRCVEDGCPLWAEPP